MNKMILVIILFMSISVFAKEGDIEVSINSGVSTGTGFGLTYNINDNLRVKLASVFIGIIDDNVLGGYSIGGALSFDIKKLNDDISSAYLFIGTNHIGIINESTIPIHLYGVGLGLRKFVDKKLFFEIEFGYALYNFNKTSQSDLDGITTFITGSLNLGYQF